MMTRTTQTDYEVGTPCNPELAAVAERVMDVRSLFFDHLDLLPEGFARIVKEHYLERVVRAESRQMLGEYAPFLLADVLRVSDESVVRQIAVPWLVVYEHALLVDDMVDGKSPHRAERLLASQLLYDDFLDTWRNWFVQCPELWQVFRRYHAQATSSALLELTEEPDSYIRTRRLADGSSRHIAMGRKAALVKFCGATLLSVYNGKVLSRKEEAGIDNICAGIQLLDDLSDCVEDRNEGRFSYPVCEALQQGQRLSGLRFPHNWNPSGDEVFDIVVLSGIAGQVARLSRVYLKAGVSDLRITTAKSPTGEFLGSLIERCAEADLATRRLCRYHSAEIKHLLKAVIEGCLSDLVTVPPHSVVWRELLMQFTKIATASN
jgi:hypothetical protein